MNDSMHINTEKIAQLSFAFLMNMIILCFMFLKYSFSTHTILITIP